MSLVDDLHKANGAANYEVRTGDSFVVPTGSFAIDYGLLQRGGINTGSMVQISGWESSGKTTLAMNLAKNTLDAGGVVILKDTEHWEHTRLQQIGLNTEKYAKEGTFIQLSESRFMEEYFSKFIDFLDIIRTSKDTVKVPTLFILDSVALTSTRTQYESVRDQKEPPIAIRARILSGALAVLEDYVKDLPAIILFVNQFRTSFEQRGFRTYVDEKVTGGNALKYAGNLHISLKAKKVYEVKELNVGNIIEAKLEKNKINFPNRAKEFLAYYNGSYGDWYTILNEGLKHGLIKQAGAWYSFKDSKWQGMDRMMSTISKEDYKDLKQAIIDEWNKEFDFLNTVGKEDVE